MNCEKIIQDGEGSQVILNEGAQAIGRDLATAILQDCSFEGQRTIYPHHVKLLGSIMERGEWLENDQLTFCRLPSGRLILVNGYHRMKAVIAHRQFVQFNIRILPVNDVAEVRGVYAAFDTANRKRSESEIIQAMGILESHGISKQVAASIYKAAPLLAKKFQSYNYQTDPVITRDIAARMVMAEEFWSLGRIYQNHINGALYRHKQKMLLFPVAAVALVTIKHQPVIAAKFWPAVASMVSLSAKDPRLTLAKCLDERQYDGVNKNGTTPQSAIDCAVAWNAFFENRQLGIIRNSSFRLAGTPWK